MTLNQWVPGSSPGGCTTEGPRSHAIGALHHIPGRSRRATPREQEHHMSQQERLGVGAQAPDFTLQNQDGREVSLSELRQQGRVIVYFYPAASTPGCTKEACDFRDSLSSLKADGFVVVGLSPDPVAKLRSFADKEGLPFELLSDEDHSVAEAYAAWGEKKNYGRTYEGLIRSTFVVEPDGSLSLAQYNVRATGHVAKLRRDLGLAS
ncbi:MAG: thioredoxin-dependent thiol peroxidase [Arthrobacter sp.]|nr:thioredoxin-dependent thiol peroxidase [Arthrobacter sp.]